MSAMKKKTTEKKQTNMRASNNEYKKKTYSHPINAIEIGENFWYVLTLSENYAETSFTKLYNKCPSEMMKERLSSFSSRKLIKHQKTR